MAVTAGAVALIRQYFREGFYPSGKRGKGFSAGQVMPGVFPQPTAAQGAPLNGYPNPYSGYGRVQLNQVLFGEENGKTAGDRLFVIDGESVATGEERVYTIPTRA